MSAEPPGTFDDDAIAPQLRKLGDAGAAEGQRMLGRLAHKMFGVGPSEPDRIARFELRERIGAGAMGVVYEAWDPELDRRVAIKLLHDAPGRRLDPNSGKRLLREAKAMAKLRHPNVVQVHEVGTHEGQVFVAMELIEGTSLRAWLAERERPWREIVEVFVKAGRGLAAAHAAGLVHRDFKPDNVLIEAGRVFVGDFGLARSHEAEARALSARPDAPSTHERAWVDGAQEDTGTESTHAETRSGELGVSTSLTRTGAFVGTPAYMPPEAFDGASPDPRADQYSFCAALYEALYGVRPWPGQTISQLLAQKARPLDSAPRPSSRAAVPRWLRRLIARGLAPAPDQRFASMDALLGKLERGLRRTRWLRRDLWIVAGFAVVASVGAIALVESMSETVGSKPPCSDGAQQLEAVWNPEREARIRAALSAGQLDYAEVLASRVVTAIDEHAQRWVAAHRGACEATHVHKQQSQRALDLRMRCLDRRRSELDALLLRFERPSTKDLLNALPAVAGLTPIDTCAAIEQLESTALIPEDPQTRAEVERLRVELDTISAALSTGAHAEVEGQAEALLEAAQRVGYKPLSAEAGVALGMIRSRIGKPKDAAATLEQAIVDAQASGHDEYAARAMIAAIHVVGYFLRDAEAGERYVRQARALLEHIGDPPRMLASYSRNVGTFEFSRGDHEAARSRFEQAVALYIEVYGETHFSVAESRANLAAVERRLGNLDTALTLYAQAKTSMEASLGPHHPNLFQLLNNMAAALLVRGREPADWVEAEAALRQALDLAAKVMPDEHASIGHPHNNLGELLVRQGRYAEAERSYDRAIESWARSYDADHPLFAHPLTGRGFARLELGDLEGAREDLERAFAIRISREGPTQPLGETEFILARTLAALGTSADETVALAHRALEHLGDRDGDLISRAEVRAWIEAR